MTKVPNTTAIILAGGRSSRMGQDKGLMDLNGRSMIQYILETVSNLTDQIIIVANNSAYQQFGFPVVEDVQKDKGPLAGIVAGLTASKTELNWIISCDSPYVSIELLKILQENLKDVEAVVPQKNEKLHPLIGAYKRSALDLFLNELNLNHLKLMPIIAQLDLKIMDANQFDLLNFKNLNSKEDL